MSANLISTSRYMLRKLLDSRPSKKQLVLRATALENMAMQCEHYLVNWPALAQSFRDDAELLQAHISDLYPGTHIVAKKPRGVRLGKSHKPPIVSPSVFAKIAKIHTKPDTP